MLLPLRVHHERLRDVLLFLPGLWLPPFAKHTQGQRTSSSSWTPGLLAVDALEQERSKSEHINGVYTWRSNNRLIEYPAQPG